MSNSDQRRRTICEELSRANITDQNGLAVFDLIRGHWPSAAAVICVFDQIELDGEDLRREPSEARKSTLKSLLRGNGGCGPESSGVAKCPARLVTSSVGDLPILVLFRRQDCVCECRVRTHWGARVAVLSVLRFIPMDVPDAATVRNVGKAFGLACKELNDAGQPDVVYEVMIKRIIAAARRSERGVKRLRDAGLTGLRRPNHRIVDESDSDKRGDPPKKTSLNTPKFLEPKR